jgi:hypothetical protein
METKPLQCLPPATLTLLAKTISEVAAASRPELAEGEHTVSDTVTLSVSGTVKVGADYAQRFVNKAKPWNIIAVLLQEVNLHRAAAGLAGVNLAQIVKAAEALDQSLADKAKAEAEKEAAAMKAPTMKQANGKVNCKGSAGLVAVSFDD